MTWHPIDTAPKDGTEVILWLPEIEDYQRARWIVSRWMGCYWGNEYSNGPAYNINSRKHPHGYMVGTQEDVRPSHWMPTPQPPKEAVPGGDVCHSAEHAVPETTPKGEQRD